MKGISVKNVFHKPITFIGEDNLKNFIMDKESFILKIETDALISDPGK